jgi:hypothetical protein
MSLSIQQLTQYAQQAGFSGSGLQNIVAIAMAESGGNPTAQNCNNPGGTCDRGVLQINNCWHPEVSDSCANDPACAFKAAYSISNNGTSFTPWTTFTSGAYKQFLNQVSNTVGNTLGSITGGQTSSSSGSPTSSNVCDVLVIGSLICSTWFEQAIFVTVGLLVALVAIVSISTSRKSST